MSYVQANFIYTDKSSSNDQYYKTPTVVDKSDQATYLQDGHLYSCYQRKTTLLKVQLSSSDQKYIFTVFSADEDKAKSILNNYSYTYDQLKSETGTTE